MTPHYRPAASVAWVDDEVLPRPGGPLPQVYVAQLPDGPALVLPGSSWAIWHALTLHDDVPTVTAAAAEMLGVPDPETIGPQVHAFLEQLLAHGLVDRVDLP